MMNKILITVFGFFATIPVFAADQTVNLLGMTYDPSGITFQVTSGGCTNKNTLEVKILETSPVQLQLVRTKPDFCEAFFPYGVQITYTFEELGLSSGSKFVISNKVAPGVIRVQ